MSASSATLKRAQVAKISNDFCSEHPSNRRDLVCLSCGGKVICIQCTTSSHRSHITNDIDSFMCTRRGELMKMTTEAKQILPQLEHKCHDRKSVLEKYTKTHEDNTIRIQRRGLELKRLIDVFMEEMTSANNEIKKRNVTKLTEFFDSVESYHQRVSNLVRKSEDHVSTMSLAEIEQLLKYMASIMNQEKEDSPECESLRMNFSEVSAGDIERLFGSMQISTKSNKHITRTLPQKQISKEQHTKINSIQDQQSDLLYSFRTSVSEIERFQTGMGLVRSLCPIGTESVWVTVEKQAFQICTNSGQHLQVVKMNAEITDLCLSNDEKYLWISSCDCTVTQIILSSASVGWSFKTGDFPWCLCVSPKDDFLVGMHGCVAIYDSTGGLLHIARDDTNDNFVKSPQKIAICKSTGDVAIIDKTKKLVVLDKILKLKFRFIGELVETMIVQNKETKPSGAELNSEFSPCGVAYDKNRNLVAADYSNKCVLLIDGKSGLCIRKIIEGTIQIPCVLAVLHDANLMVGFIDGEVKMYKYLNTADHNTKL